MKSHHLRVGIAALALAACAAHAATNTTNYVPPTQYDDNVTTLPASQIAGYDITCRLVPVTGADQACTLSKTRLAGGTATSDTLTATIPAAGGQLCIKVKTVTTTGLTSTNFSNETCKTFAAVNPNPPTGLQIVQLNISIPLNSGDGFNRTLAMSITSSGPGVPAGFVKVSTPAVGEPVFAWRGQNWCRFLAAHPKTGASNVEWIKGVSASTDAAAPCA